MKKRLFFAVPLSEKYLEIFVSYRDNFAQKGIRWTNEENLHLTVCFFGDIEEGSVSDLVSDLKRSLSQIKPFALKFDKIMLAPPARPPRMIWGMFFGKKKYQDLTGLVFRAAEKYLEEKQELKWMPHVTLARFKDFFDPSGLKLIQVELPDFLISSCRLVSSDLTPAGPIYKTVEIFNL